MRTSYLLGSALLIVAGLLNVSAQESCALKISQSPQVRGLRLGMTTAQVSSRYPRLPILRADEFGQIKANLGNLKIVDDVAFTGVNSIALNFIDDRLVEYVVNYESAPWDNIDQFLAKVREAFGLPGGWSGEGYSRRLSCHGFQIDVGASSYSVNWASTYLRIKELGSEEILAKRAAEKRERQRQTFKL